VTKPIRTQPEDVDVQALGNAIEFLENQNLACANFVLKPWAAYSLVAVLQACARQPDLSDAQLTLIVGFARQIAEQLYSMADALLGTPNLVHEAVESGFDSAHDRLRPTER
jgi:hypothetical protein